MKLFGKYFIQIIYLSTIINSVKGSPLDVNSTILSTTIPELPTTISAKMPTTVPTTIPTTIPEATPSAIIPETTISSTNPIFNNNEPYNSSDWTTISNLDTTMDIETNIEEVQITEIIDPVNPLPTSLEENINNNYDDSDKCWDIEPTKGIINDCILGVQLKNDTCCYMTVEYKYNTLYACIPVLKDKNEIERRIEILKNIYTENKSIKINCFVSFIKLNLIFLLLIFLYD